MKKILKSKNGITLIALIITIIVLIILAGISIAVLTGEDGLITKAKQGAQNYQNAAIEEQQALNTIYAQAGTQLTTGSTNNNGTPVNQGTSTTGGSGLTQEEHQWLERVSKLPNFSDVNPTKIKDKHYGLSVSTNVGYLPLPEGSWNAISVCQDGTKKRMCFYDESFNAIGDYIELTTSWQNFEIPANARMIGYWSYDGYSTLSIYYALFTADSQYNPYNQ